MNGEIMGNMNLIKERTIFPQVFCAIKRKIFAKVLANRLAGSRRNDVRLFLMLVESFCFKAYALGIDGSGKAIFIPFRELFPHSRDGVEFSDFFQFFFEGWKTIPPVVVKTRRHNDVIEVK